MSLSSMSNMFALGVLVLHMVASVCASDPVWTKQGRVRGIRQDIQDYKGLKKTIYKFLGVPYAEKPIGDLRFKRPQALKSWGKRIYNATYFRPVCLQNKGHYGRSIKTAWPEFDHEKDISEDCLYLNIYTPSIDYCQQKYPVIFYIHGGSYVAGTPIRDRSPGEYLPTRDVVLVTIQYRLGVFGFFTTGDSEAPGNVGLLDQVEALKWVQDNIESFCGDENSVTLLGESAGGSSVALHYLSPLSKGLFHRGIAVSGLDFCPFAYRQKSEVLAGSNHMADIFNCAGKTSAEKLRCLQSVRGLTILKHAEETGLGYQPFVDNHFLPDHPEKLRQEGKFHKLPFMSGFVSHEGSFLLPQDNISLYNMNLFENYVEKILFSEYHFQKKDAVVAYDAVRFQYTPWADIKNPHKIRKKMVDMLSDYYVAAPTHAALVYHSDHGAPTYMFEFAHRSRHHPLSEWMGVVHDDTTAYKFGLPLLSTRKTNLTFDESDRNISDLVTTIYTNFAKFGHPTPTSVHGIQWDMFDSSSKGYLKIQKNPVMTRNYHPIRMAFWNSYLPSLFPEKPSPPTIEESKTGSAVALRGSTFVFVIYIGMLGRILGCNE